MTNPESFKSKLTLMLIEKLIIGAIIAIAIFVYDRYKTVDNREYEQKRAETQLAFERSRLIKEFMPVIQNESLDLVSRAYILRSAILAKAIDPEAAFEIGQDFLRKGLERNHFIRLVSSMLPHGISSFSRRGVQISAEWYESFKSLMNIETLFDPVSGRENLPVKEASMIIEARLLSDVLYKELSTLNDCDCPELTEEAEIPSHLYGLYVLMKTSNRDKAEEASNSTAELIRLVGMLNRLALNSSDNLATTYLSNRLDSAGLSKDKLRLSRVIVSIMGGLASEGNVRSARGFSPLLAGIAVGKFTVDTNKVEGYDLYWLRFNAAEALFRTGEHAEHGSSVINRYISQLAARLVNATAKTDLERLSTEYESGKILRVLVGVIGNIKSEEGFNALRELHNIGEDKLRYFPFLKEDLVRALNLSEE